ncbi:gag/pol protein [Cucumis melo var. makuwa]|uniref:Gag/pol protein n=1 Tax=Cucumis melo var. makuwa TaxID=1194695 RepID=A0A5D3CE32_CUCMM|nr:gag/pol protein [Cucumis melo var. makuwa]
MANDKARVYILASMFDILSKKYEIMVTTRQIMYSLREMFGQPSIHIMQEAIKYIYNARMKDGQSVREHVLNMIVHFNETTSFKQLEKGEMTLKGYAAEIAVHILNNVPSKSVSEAPFELLREHDGVEDPLTYKQAMNDVDKDQWVKAIDLEMESMYFNSMWELVNLPKGVSSKSTSGSMFTLNERAVVWHSIKQGCIADSTMKANIATCKATKEAVWLKKFLHDLEVVPNMNLLSLYIVIIVEQ